jgi:16S rRNA (cytosine1402-N4)-methyltransferase
LPGEPVPPPATFDLVGKQPVIAGSAELARNPRARSAKLRTGQRTDAPARGLDADLAAMAALPARPGKGR